MGGLSWRSRWELSPLAKCTHWFASNSLCFVSGVLFAVIFLRQYESVPVSNVVLLSPT